VEYEKLSDDRLGEPSQAIRDRVEAARDSRWSQRGRFEGTRLLTNADTPALARRCKCGARGGAGAVPDRRRGQEPAQGRHAAAPDERPGLPPDPEAGAHHR
jgi:hypothetical protein